MLEGWLSRVLITGVAGSAGSYLAEFICTSHPDVEVHGIAGPRTARANLEAIRDRVQIHEADLLDFGSILRVLEVVRPDAVVHLAAHANVRASFVTPTTVLSNNILGTSNLLEAVRVSSPGSRLLLCSTSEVYGQVSRGDLPVREEAPFRPASPYAVSKVAQDMLGHTYFVAYGLQIVRTRMFGYINPRRVDLFATSFAKQIAWIEAGLQSELVHGNLESVRTFLDVRDAMRAYWLALLYCRPGEVYNIGGTQPWRIGDILDRLIALSTVPIRTRLDPALLRPADIAVQIPCVDKFVKATGWKPEHGLEESLRELLEHWRREAKKAGGAAGR